MFDTGGDVAWMQSINDAYEILADPAKKAPYDVYRRQRSASSGSQSTHREEDCQGHTEPPRPPPQPRVMSALAAECMSRNATRI
jgi:curved DNA-binding protein CbpA